MEIVQTCTGTWRWCMGMFGARFAVFVRRARVLPGPCPATRNLSFLRFHRRRRTVVSTLCFNSLFTGLVYDGLKLLLDGNRTNTYGHVALVHPHFCVAFLRVPFVPWQRVCWHLLNEHSQQQPPFLCLRWIYVCRQGKTWCQKSMPLCTI